LIGYEAKVMIWVRIKKLTRVKIEKSLSAVFCMDIQALPTKKSGRKCPDFSNLKNQ
jgi:hypothetical protein